MALLRDGKQELLILGCTAPLNMILLEKLGEGVEGAVYHVCDTTNVVRCNLVLKVEGILEEGDEENDEEEVDGQVVRKTEAEHTKSSFIAYVAGLLGIGPRIERYGRCSPVAKDKFYTVMQNLSGPTLANRFPYSAKDVNDALNLNLNLLKAGYAQRDGHLDNYMFDGKRLYLIDYGAAISRPSYIDTIGEEEWWRTTQLGIATESLLRYGMEAPTDEWPEKKKVSKKYRPQVKLLFAAIDKWWETFGATLLTTQGKEA